MLKIYTDENVERAIAEGLKRRNIIAISANEAGNLGLSDEEQLEFAVSEGACLFTYDLDFFESNTRWNAQGREHYGIIYVHPLNANIGECIKKLTLYAKVYEKDELRNRILFL